MGGGLVSNIYRFMDVNVFGGTVFGGMLNFPSRPVASDAVWPTPNIFSGGNPGPSGGLVGPFAGGQIVRHDSGQNVLKNGGFILTYEKQPIGGRIRATSAFHKTSYPIAGYSNAGFIRFFPGMDCFLGFNGKNDPRVAELLEDHRFVYTFRAFVSLYASLDCSGGFMKNEYGEIKAFYFAELSVPAVQTVAWVCPPGDFLRPAFVRALHLCDPQVEEPGDIVDYYTFCNDKIAVNADVTPPSGTRYPAGSYVPVYIEAHPGRELEHVIIGGVDYTNVESYEPVGDPSVTYDESSKCFRYTFPPDSDGTYKAKPIANPERRRFYVVGPMNADFCVNVKAGDKILPADEQKRGVPFSIPIETDECWPLKTWELLDDGGLTNVILPEAAGSKTNTLTGVVPLNYESENAEILIRLNGKYRALDVKIRFDVTGAPAFGNVWEAVSLVEAGIKDLLVSTDGTVYLATANKIFKAGADLVFEELVLTGTVSTSFGGLAEASDGRILAMDKRYIWKIDPDGNGFTVTAMQNSARYWNRGYRVTADPSSNIVFAHGTSGLGYARLARYNLDTETLIDSLDIPNAYFTHRRGILTANGDWIFAASGPSAGGNIIAFLASSDDTIHVALKTTARTSEENDVVVMPDGKIIAVASATTSTTKVYRSDNIGLGFGDAEEIPRWVYVLFPVLDSVVLAGGQRVFRSEDSLVTSPAEVLDNLGLVTAFGRMPDGTLLCATDSSSTANLYKSTE